MKDGFILLLRNMLKAAKD